VKTSVLYYSAAGGTRLVARLLGELAYPERPVRAVDVESEREALEAAEAEFLVLCFPVFFLEPAPAILDFVGRLPDSGKVRRAFLVATYELYPGNAARRLALALGERSIQVVGTASIRAPGTDVVCALPDRLVPWLYRFEPSLEGKLRAAAAEIARLAAEPALPGRFPGIKWYTPLAWLPQRLLFDRFIGWRKFLRALPERCTACGACASDCLKGCWRMEGGLALHESRACDLCTRCVHGCPRRAIVLVEALKDNRRLDKAHYARLEEEARAALFAGQGGRR
jgi:ferredoxin